jgi:Endomembrane protein 70
VPSANSCCIAGVQLALLVLFVVLITIAGTLFVERGTIVTVFILCYALTSFVGGYVGGSFYSKNDGKAWIQARAVCLACLYEMVTCEMSGARSGSGYGHHASQLPPPLRSTPVRLALPT